MALGAGAVLAQSLSVDRLELHGVKAEPVTWRGRAAVRITDTGGMQG